MADETGGVPAGSGFPPVEPIAAGLLGRCPRCGKGRLFAGFLRLDRQCEACGLDYGFADSGDGPAVFAMLVVGFIVVGLALWAEVNYSPPFWLHLVLWVPLAIILCLGSLRLMKGVLVTLQYRNEAAEGRWSRRK
ncbi:MAG: DUF983 domain-containing protein [Methylobacterium mesophilicum]|nr:DUF983 domain-containing protein [Methylobacterium mesophilicum]